MYELEAGEDRKSSTLFNSMTITRFNEILGLLGFQFPNFSQDSLTSGEIPHSDDTDCNDITVDSSINSKRKYSLIYDKVNHDAWSKIVSL